MTWMGFNLGECGGNSVIRSGHHQCNPHSADRAIFLIERRRPQRRLLIPIRQLHQSTVPKTADQLLRRARSHPGIWMACDECHDTLGAPVRNPPIPKDSQRALIDPNRPPSRIPHSRTRGRGCKKRTSPCRRARAPPPSRNIGMFPAAPESRPWLRGLCGAFHRIQQPPRGDEAAARRNYFSDH